MRQPQNNNWGTISRIGGWGMNTKIIKTESLLHLDWEVFLFFILFIFYIILFFIFLYIFSFTYFLFLFLFLFFLFFIFNPLSL
jgi:hypothetical protein